MAADDLEQAINRLANAIDKLEGAIGGQDRLGSTPGDAGGSVGRGVGRATKPKPKSNDPTGFESLIPNWQGMTDDEIRKAVEEASKRKPATPPPPPPPPDTAGPGNTAGGGSLQRIPVPAEQQPPQRPKPDQTQSDQSKPAQPPPEPPHQREQVPWNRKRPSSDWLGDAVGRAASWQRPGIGRDLSETFAGKIGKTKAGRAIRGATARFGKTKLGRAIGTKATQKIVGRAVGRGSAAVIGRGVGMVGSAVIGRGAGAAAGAAIGSAGGPAGMLVGLAVGVAVEKTVGAAIDALSKFKAAIQDGTREQIRYNRQFAEFSAGMAAVEGERELREAARKTEKGNRMSGTARNLMRAEQNYEDDTKNLDVLMGNVKNSIYAFGERLLGRVMKPLDKAAEAANKYLFGDDDKSGLSFYQWMQEIQKDEEASRAKAEAWHNSFDRPDGRRQLP